MPLSTIIAANPDAVVGGVGLNQGSGNPALTVAVDALVIGWGSEAPTLYDFEPFVSPATRDACKNDGWQLLRRANGESFRNQGDCVSYVQTGR